MITCILSIARTTFTELVRQKVFYFLVIFALVTIGGSIFAEKISSTSNLMGAQFQMLKDTSLGSMSIFTALLAILATANFPAQGPGGSHDLHHAFQAGAALRVPHGQAGWNPPHARASRGSR